MGDPTKALTTQSNDDIGGGSDDDDVGFGVGCGDAGDSDGAVR